MSNILAFFSTSFFQKYVLTPLAVFGFYQIFRGVTTIIERDLAQQDWLNGWLVIAYILATVLGCICLVIVL